MFRDLPPLDGLTTVLAAARHDSFSAAAQELGLTHGTVSRQVAAVERWLGYRIFTRHGRGVRPTAEGQRFISRIGEAFGTIAESSERWRGRKGPDVVRISTLPAFAKIWLLDRVTLIQGQPQDVRLELRIEHAFANVVEGDADIAVRCGHGNWRGVRAVPLAAETVFPVAAPQLLASGPLARPDRKLSAQDLLHAPLIHDSDGAGWVGWFGSLGLAYRPRTTDLRFEDYDVVLSAAEAGLGIALARWPIVHDRLAEGRLVRCHAHEARHDVCYHLVTAPAEPRDPVRRVIDRMIRAARDGASARDTAAIAPGRQVATL